MEMITLVGLWLGWDGWRSRRYTVVDKCGLIKRHLENFDVHLLKYYEPIRDDVFKLENPIIKLIMEDNADSMFYPSSVRDKLKQLQKDIWSLKCKFGLIYDLRDDMNFDIKRIHIHDVNGKLKKNNESPQSITFRLHNEKNIAYLIWYIKFYNDFLTVPINITGDSTHSFNPDSRADYKSNVCSDLAHFKNSNLPKPKVLTQKECIEQKSKYLQRLFQKMNNIESEYNQIKKQKEQMSLMIAEINYDLNKKIDGAFKSWACMWHDSFDWSQIFHDLPWMKSYE